MTKRIRAVPGGTSASKTVSIDLVLTDLAQTDRTPTLTSIVSESLPHLKRGAMRDFLNIIREHKYYKDSRWNKSDLTYHFETGSMIEFFSADMPSKVRGPRRDRLFLNEANNLPFETFEQLEVRTKEFVFMDWNPTNEFWYYTDVKGVRDDVEEQVLTYLDNEALDPNIIRSIELRKSRKSWWNVYGLGQLGEVAGRIYTGWQVIDEIPHEARLVARWLDFGYTNDPSSIGDVYYYNGGYIVDELLYQKGMLNKQLADFLLNQESPNTLVIADSAEPKSIDEISGYGVNIIGVSKKRGESSTDTFVKWSISKVQDQRISMTKRSINTIKEYRNYLWLEDKNGKILNEEDPMCANHSMSGIRYVFASISNTNFNDEQEQAERLRSRLRQTVNQTR